MISVIESYLFFFYKWEPRQDDRQIETQFSNRKITPTIRVLKYQKLVNIH